MESLRVVVESHLTESQSLKNTFTTLEELDERRWTIVQHIEAIQRRRKITFDKWHKIRNLRPCMMVLLQNSKKLEFSGKCDVVWLGPYLICEAFSNNFLQLETLNGDSFPTCTSGGQCEDTKLDMTTCLRRINYVSPILCLHMCFILNS